MPLLTSVVYRTERKWNRRSNKQFNARESSPYQFERIVPFEREEDLVLLLALMSLMRRITIPEVMGDIGKLFPEMFMTTVHVGGR